MRYVTSIERLAKEEGIEQGIIQKGREDVIEILEIRFSAVPTEIVEIINGIEDESVLKTLHRRAIAISLIAEFQQLLNEVISPQDLEGN